MALRPVGDVSSGSYPPKVTAPRPLKQVLVSDFSMIENIDDNKAIRVGDETTTPYTELPEGVVHELCSKFPMMDSIVNVNSFSKYTEHVEFLANKRSLPSTAKKLMKSILEYGKCICKYYTADEKRMNMYDDGNDDLDIAVQSLNKSPMGIMGSVCLDISSDVKGDVLIAIFVFDYNEYGYEVKSTCLIPNDLFFAGDIKELLLDWKRGLSLSYSLEPDETAAIKGLVDAMIALLPDVVSEARGLFKGTEIGSISFMLADKLCASNKETWMGISKTTSNGMWCEEGEPLVFNDGEYSVFYLLV